MTTVELQDLTSKQLEELAKEKRLSIVEIESTGRYTMVTLGSEGDVKAVWNPNDEVERKAVKKLFKTLMAEGRAAFQAVAGGAKGDQIRDFDEAQGSIILSRPPVGG